MIIRYLSWGFTAQERKKEKTFGTPGSFRPYNTETYFLKKSSIHALGLSYPGPPTMAMSVALAKTGNTGKSYTAYLKPLVTAEWIRQLTASQPPQPAHATPTGRTQAHFMIHGPSLYNNLYKIPPYLNICTECNPMSLTGIRFQSQQLIPTHKFTIENAQRVTYDQKLCPYCDQHATGNDIHILLQCPGTKHIANDLIATLATLLTHSHQPTWNSLTLYQQTSIMLADPSTTLPKKFHQTWLHATLSHILTYIAAFETHLYNMSHALQLP